LSEIARSWRRTDAMRSLSRSVLLLKLDELLKGIPPSGLVVSFSHDNYTSNVGGIQLCLAIEQQAFNADDVAYLHLSPWQPSPMLYSGRDPDQVGMRVLFNGTEVGNTLGSEMVAVVQALRTRWSAVPAWLVVHALHGHSTETVSQIHAKLQPTRAFFWLHDYFSACTGYNLLRNQVAFCSAPDSGSPACGICIYGESRARHLPRIEALFAAVPFTAVAPSRHAAMLWQQSTALSVAETLVVPHCEVVFEGQRLDGVSGWDEAEDVATEANKLRVAFLGHPVVHKGWPVFQELVRQLCGTGQYEFWHLGTQPDLQLPIKFIEVKVTPGETDAMIRALEANSIDVVVQWSIWPETFGIAARECVAAGAYLVTSTTSGAVADFVLESGGGLVLETEAALVECFRSGQLLEVVCERRRAGVSVGRLEWGRLTAGLIAPATVVRARG